MTLWVAEPTRSVPKRLADLRSAIANRILASMLAVAVIGVPVSVSRAFETGWLPVYTIHAVIGAVMCATYLARHRLSILWRVGAVVGLCWTVGLIGLVSFGLLGAGVWWLVISVLLVGVMYSPAIGALVAIPAVLVVSLTGLAFIKGWLQVSFDVESYMVQPSSWATLMIGAGFMPFLLFQAISVLRTNTLEVLTEVEAQRLRIKELSLHDELTGLPRMALTLDRLDRALVESQRNGRKVGAIFVDLDGFKAVNDTHGHEAGDAVLREVAARLTSALREGDTVARRGGDEFLVLVPNLESPDLATDLAEKLLAALVEPIPSAERVLTVGASLGVAIAPDDATEAPALVEAADQAMYAAKHAGKNRVVTAGSLPRPGG